VGGGNPSSFLIDKTSLPPPPSNFLARIEPATYLVAGSRSYHLVRNPRFKFAILLSTWLHQSPNGSSSNFSLSPPSPSSSITHHPEPFFLTSLSFVHLHAGEGAVLHELGAAQAPPRGEVPVEVHAQAVLRILITPAHTGGNPIYVFPDIKLHGLVPNSYTFMYL
jgi:hypothetical protein